MKQKKALMKLAQARLAIDYILRSRMTKQAEVPFGTYGHVHPQYEYLMRLADLFENNPNNAQVQTVRNNPEGKTIANDLRNIVYRGSLPVTDERYYTSDQVMENANPFFSMYNGDDPYISRENGVQLHGGLPLWGIDDVMTATPHDDPNNLNDPASRTEATQNWILNHKGPNFLEQSDPSFLMREMERVPKSITGLYNRYLYALNPRENKWQVDWNNRQLARQQARANRGNYQSGGNRQGYQSGAGQGNYQSGGNQYSQTKATHPNTRMIPPPLVPPRQSANNQANVPMNRQINTQKPITKYPPAAPLDGNSGLYRSTYNRSF